MATQEVNWKAIVENGDLVMCSEEEAKRQKIYPNRYGFPKDQPRTALILFQESNGLFRVMKASMHFMEAKLKEGIFESAHVVMLRSGDNAKFELVRVQ